MVAVTLSRAEGTASGVDAEVGIGSTPRRANATAVGYPVLVLGAVPAAGTTPDSLRLEILTASGTQLINDLDTRRGLSFVVEHNGAGSVQFETDLDALPDGIESALLDPSNLVRIHCGALAQWPNGVAEGFLAAAPPVKDPDTGRWTVQVAGLGSEEVLELGALWPPAGATGDTREFSYTAGMTSPSYVPAEWGQPYQYNVKRSFRWDHRWPAGWPESSSEWIWDTSPEKRSPLGTREFIGSFTLPGRHDVHFYTAGDETLRLYLNGALLKKKGFGAWKKTASFVRTLPAGTYQVAASVANVAGGNNKSGFIFAAARLKADGSRHSWLLRSSKDTFQVKKVDAYIAQVPLPPDGWYPADVLRQHVTEAAARGVQFHPSITLTFTGTADSTGSAWTAKGPVEYDIGTSGVDLLNQVRAAGVDAAMLPGLQLSAWKQRGFDLSAHAVVSLPMNAQWTSRTWSRVRSVGLTQHEAGWTETAGDATVLADYGRRELTVSGGGTEGDQQADVLARLAMITAASPEETIEVSISTADIRDGAPQPFRDFNVADVISVEMVGGYETMKVMSIAAAEADTKEVRWTVSGYPT